MNKRFVLLTFASVFLLSAVIGPQLIVSVAAPLNVGVGEGDWAEYACMPSGNGTIAEITWMKLIVQEISGTNITVQQIVRYANTTEETATGVVDVVTGQVNATGLFIAANLTAGDLIYTDPPSERAPNFQGATINETVTREYLGENVEVNYWNITVTDTHFGEGTWTLSYSYYWYKATGMLVDLSFHSQFQPLEGDMVWTKFEATIINIIPEFPSALILPLFIIATLLPVIIYRRKHTA